MKQEKDKSAYPPLHHSVEEKRGAARGLRLNRVEATVHIDVDFLHPLREGLELHKPTHDSLAAVITHPWLDFTGSETEEERGGYSYHKALAAGGGSVETLHGRVRGSRHGRGRRSRGEAVATRGREGGRRVGACGGGGLSDEEEQPRVLTRW